MIEDVELISAKFMNYLDLNYNQSKSDPDEEPYKTKYEARKCLETLIEQIPSQLSHLVTKQDDVELELKQLINSYEYFYNRIDEPCNKKFQMSSKSFLLRKLLEFNLAKNLIETEEIEQGEKLLSKIVREFNELNETGSSSGQPLGLNPLYASLNLSCFNELIFVWSNRADYLHCFQLMEPVDQLYEAFKNESLKNLSLNENSIEMTPFDPIELIQISKELTRSKRRTNFESLYTHSLFYFAQVHGKLDNKDESAYYCYLTLQRQLTDRFEQNCDENKSNEEENTKFIEQPQEKVKFNELEWATHAAAISQYYVCENDFATARHCLCCAESILERIKDELSVSNTNLERFNEQKASIQRCWGKYAIALLKYSKEVLKKSTEANTEIDFKKEMDKVSRFHFKLPRDRYKLDEAQLSAITSNMALDFDQARKIFLKAQSILNEAKEYFKLDGYVTDHCEIVRDLSDLYGALIFYEEDLERRCKMHKRRLDMLVPICDEINSQFYLQLKRQLLFDVGTIYSELLDAKTEILKEKREKNTISHAESLKAVQKINTLAESSIKHFDQFLDTMKVQPKREVLPDKFDDHNVRPALLAKFYLGRLYSKIIELDKEKSLGNMKRTLDCYSYLVEYCDKELKNGNDFAVNTMHDEYTACKEMIAFLPAKMDKMKSSIS
jgi:hypothetical protein